MSKVIVEVIKAADIPATVKAVNKAVSVAKAVNSTKTYKHKDKVEKALDGATVALDVGYSIYRLFKR